MKKTTLFATALCLSLSLFAQPYTPTQANLDVRQWFQDAKFGLFIHWGAYSVLSDGEWVMNNKKMAHKDYQKVVEAFNPTQFDAAEWVSLVKASGIQYTSRLRRNTTMALRCGTVRCLIGTSLTERRTRKMC